jgi:hypothetical protein
MHSSSLCIDAVLGTVLRIQRITPRVRFSSDSLFDGRTSGTSERTYGANAVMSGMRLAGDNQKCLFFAALAEARPFRDLLARKEA